VAGKSGLLTNENRMSKAKYWFLAIVTFILIVGLPFISLNLCKTTNDIIVTIFTIMSGLCSVAGIVFAFLIYRKLGIDEAIISKKSEVVFKFIEDLRQLHFTIETNDETLLVSFNRLQSFIGLDVYNKHYHKIVLLHKSTISDIHHITDQTNNLFLPTEISDALRPLDFGVVYKMKGVLTKYAKVSTNDRNPIWTVSKEHVYKEGEDFYGIADYKEMNLKEFLTLWDIVVATTLNWIHNNTSEQKLNYPKKMSEADLKLLRKMVRLENWG